MPQLQTWIVIAAIASPFIPAIIGILIDHSGLNRLEQRIDSRKDRLDGRLDTLNQTLHNVVKGLLGMIGDQGQRVVRLEERRYQ